MISWGFSAVMSDHAVNIHIQVFKLTAPGYKSRSGIAGSYAKFTYNNLLRNCETVCKVAKTFTYAHCQCCYCPCS